MKKIILKFGMFFSAATPNFVFAQASANLGPVSIVVSVQNLSGVELSAITIEPNLECSTTTPDFARGEAYTSTNQAALSFTSESQAIDERRTDFRIRIKKSSSIVAPESSSLWSRSSCWSYATMKLMTKYPEPEDSLHQENYFTQGMGLVSSKSKSTDFTDSFRQALQGEYILKLVEDGTAFDSRSQKQVPVCILALFKKEASDLEFIGKSISFLRYNCSTQNIFQ
jgi:hypothetical protein